MYKGDSKRTSQLWKYIEIYSDDCGVSCGDILKQNTLSFSSNSYFVLMWVLLVIWQTSHLKSISFQIRMFKYLCNMCQMVGCGMLVSREARCVDLLGLQASSTLFHSRFKNLWASCWFCMSYRTTSLNNGLVPKVNCRPTWRIFTILSRKIMLDCSSWLQFIEPKHTKSMFHISESSQFEQQWC